MGSYFKNQSLNDWYAIQPGEVLQFAARGARRVKFTVNANADTEIWAYNGTDGENAVLVGCGKGQFDVEYTASGHSEVSFLAPEDASIYLRGTAADHRVAARDVPKYTSIEPRQRRNSEFDRMMMLMRLNQKRMEDQMAAQAEQFEKRMKQAEEKPNPKADDPKPKAEEKTKPKAQDPEPKAEGPKPKGGENDAQD